MPQPLPLEDFRAVRIVLKPDDFAVGSELPDLPPKDLILKETWFDLVMLPDDVSIRTTNHYGTILKNFSELKAEFVSVSLALQQIEKSVNTSPLSHVLIDASDEFDASIYNSMTGYYRLAFSALRNVVEHLTIGLHLGLSGDQPTFVNWLAGKELKFGWAADLALSHSSIRSLESHFRTMLNDDIFRQRTQTDPGGFARRMFGNLSKYTHGCQGYTDADIRQSNGPIFVPNTFIQWAVCFVQVLAFSLILSKLAQPKLNRLRNSSVPTIAELFTQVSGMLRPNDDGVQLFQNLPVWFW